VARPIRDRASAGSNLGRNSIEAPASITVWVATNRPWTWKIGSAWISTSSAVNRHAATRPSAFDTRFAWLSMAPLERPVVPEV